MAVSVSNLPSSRPLRTSWHTHPRRIPRSLSAPHAQYSTSNRSQGPAPPRAPIMIFPIHGNSRTAARPSLIHAGLSRRDLRPARAGVRLRVSCCGSHVPPSLCLDSRPASASPHAAGSLWGGEGGWGVLYVYRAGQCPLALFCKTASASAGQAHLLVDASRRVAPLQPPVPRQVQGLRGLRRGRIPVVQVRSSAGSSASKSGATRRVS